MKSPVQRFLWVILASFIGITASMAQVPGKPYVPYGGTFTPQGRMDVLVVYAGFTNDLNPASPIYNHADWPAEQEFPNYADEIFYPDSTHFSLDARDKSLSNYFYQMSKASPNPLRVVGHRLEKRINVMATNEGNRKGWRHYFSEVYKEMQKLDGVDWKKFDQRKNDPQFLFDNSDSQPDGQIDFVIVVFRFDGDHLPFGTTTPFRNGYGLSTLFSKGTIKTPNDETLKITTGFSISRGINGPGGIRGFFLHENAHELYRMPHVFGTNSAIGNKFNITNGWGMMGINKVLNCANSWERWMLGWIDIQHDLEAKRENNGTYELRDYLSTGDAIRIEIPHTDGKQHLWIENHQGESIFDERDSWNGELFPPKPRGILMYTECMPSSRMEIPKVYDYQQVNGFKTLSAAGNYDYLQSDTFKTHWEIGGNPAFNFIPSKENPLSGFSDVDEIRLDYKGTDLKNPKDKIAKPDGEITTRYSHGNELGCKTCKSETALNAKHNGTLNFPFLGENIGFEEGDVLNLGSNPMVTNIRFYHKDQDSLDPFYLNQIFIRIKERKPNGTMVLEIRFDNNEIDETTRYTGEIIVPNNPNLDATGDHDSLRISNEFELVLKQGKLLTINNSGTPNKAKADENGSFVRPTTFTLAKNSRMKLEKGSILLIEEGCSLNLEEGSELIIGPKAKLIIAKGATFNGATGSHLTVINNGKIKERGTVRFNGKTHFINVKGEKAIRAAIRMISY